jgi:predicted GNAT family acetyltransferase
MTVTMIRQEVTATFADVPESWQPSSVSELGRHDEPEVLDFLAARPTHTVFMMGLIHDHGLISPRNRGSFYGSRTRKGILEGVALIGHVTMIEAHTEDAIASLARAARNCRNLHLVRGEQRSTQTFWSFFADAGQQPRMACFEHLLEIKAAAPGESQIDDMRPATMETLEVVLGINAALALEEGGTNPLQTDSTGFRARTAERIERGRVWVWIHDGELVFKADVVSETPAATYLEGIYVNPDQRRKGYGLHCLNQLCAHLLQSSASVCLTVNERNRAALALYRKAGFNVHSKYETIYLQ